jgi:hypothetical protein
MSIALVPGSTYYAGANRPWFATQGLISDYLRGKEFENVQWHKRANPLPSTVDPRASEDYSDDWDEWVSADYVGAVGTISPPIKLPWFIVHLPSVATAVKTGAVTNPPTATRPSWQIASEQASRAAAAAAIASQAAKSGVLSPSVAPVPPSPAADVSAPRDSSAVNPAGVAVLAGGFAVLLFGVVQAILPRRRR